MDDKYENELIDLAIAIHADLERGRMGYAVDRLRKRDEQWKKACDKGGG